MNVPPAGWLTDASAVQNPAFGAVPGAIGNGVGIGYGANEFGAHGVNPNMQAAIDPTMGMMMPQGHMGMDPNLAHFQGNPMAMQAAAQQRMAMQNGSARGMPGGQVPHTPMFPPQQQVPVSTYNVNPVVPMKRPRPREDSISMSPGQTHMALPTSRSQTPLSQNQAMAYQMYQNGQPGQQRQFPVGMQPSEASPSPVMANQQFPMQNGNAIPPKRMSTQSPSPYINQQGFGMPPQGSPTATEHLSRAPTPQSAHSPGIPPPNSSMPPNQPGFTGYPSQFANAPNVTHAPMASPIPQPGMNNPMQMQAIAHQKRMMANQQMMQLQQQQQHRQMAAAAGQPVPGQPPQTPRAGVPQHAPQQKPQDPGLFVKNLKEFMAQRGSPITQLPSLNGQPVNLMALYTTVLRGQGSRRITMAQQWPQIASMLGYGPDMAEEISKIHAQYLGPFEAAFLSRNQMRKQGQVPPGTPGQAPPGTPTRPPDQAALAQHPPPQTPLKDQSGAAAQVRMQNGMATPIPPQLASRHSTPHSQPPTTPKIPTDVPPSPFPPTAPPGSAKSLVQDALSSQLQASPTTVKHEGVRVFEPKVRVLDTHGGYNVKVLKDMIFQKPLMPAYNELGAIDIHALTMMLKSGIPGETRLALDTLAVVSVAPGPALSLQFCEDLTDALLDVADGLSELLAEHTETISESVCIPSYEQTLRGAKAEGDLLAEVSRLGTLEYDLDRAAEKLVCITTILRNLSFFTCNHPSLVDPAVVKFVSRTIELMGSKELFFRTHVNTLDFMKDIIIFLSNTSQEIVLPGQDEAFNLLQLILAFAPTPLPAASGRDRLMFSPYQPSIHKYLPPAVDSLAKLLARDEPNRTFFRNIYLSEQNTQPAYDLLTQSFALAISPIPEGHRPLQLVSQTAEIRKPFLEQGMLAADILASICPPPSTHSSDPNSLPEPPLARDWLQSEDGFAGGLIRLVSSLGLFSKPADKHDDLPAFARITRRGLTILQKLIEKSGEDPLERSKVHVSGLPTVDRLMGALLTAQLDPFVVKKLFELCGMT